MKVLLIFEVILILVLYIASKGKYQELLKEPESKEYSMMSFAPMSMLLLDRINYRYNSKYDKKIQKLLVSIYGERNSGTHMKLFYSSKLTSMIFTLVILTLFGAAAEEPDYTFLAFTLSMPLLIFYLYDKELEKKQRKKYDIIRADFPDMVSKMVLLVNAGMTLSRAWEKICIDTKKDTPLYKELRITYQQIQAGKPEAEAYEDFARRCRVKEITKFITLIIQNLKKGSGDLVPLLKLQADECWELRKGRAKQLGDEASEKLILPLMIMFIGILII
ncbi:MAG: Flp pilus assembly protein TadC, partial [Clostridia bacterium]|nr:Flp pilus assembly protein TadC [Clostridia bacterium]